MATCEAWVQVNDQTTQGMIDAALGSAKGDVTGALNIIIGRRNYEAGGCCDLNLTAADHYFVGRKMTARGIPLFLAVEYIQLYAVGKLVGVIPQLGRCPVSPYNNDVIQWGMKGAADGNAE